MGVEAVAVHIVDKWFTSGNARPESDIELMNARIFADFNRASLVGMPAPGLTLKNRAGEDVDLFGWLILTSIRSSSRLSSRNMQPWASCSISNAAISAVCASPHGMMPTTYILIIMCSLIKACRWTNRR